MNHWVRLWHDMPTDPKWRVIARKSGQSVSTVIAVFNFMLVNASLNESERGRIKGFVCEDVASSLDLDPEDIECIVSAMQGKVIDGERLTGWDRRQPKREDGKATERVNAWRERNALKHNETHVKRNETLCNASEQNGNACNAERNAPDTDTDTEKNKNLSPAEPKHPSALEVSLQDVSAKIHSRHPLRRRDCSAGAVASKLKAILKIHRKGRPEAEKIDFLKSIEQHHARKCSSGDWQKEGGEFAKSLENWMAPTMDRYMPGSAAELHSPLFSLADLPGHMNPGLLTD